MRRLAVAAVEEAAEGNVLNTALLLRLRRRGRVRRQTRTTSSLMSSVCATTKVTISYVVGVYGYIPCVVDVNNVVDVLGVSFVSVCGAHNYLTLVFSDSYRVVIYLVRSG